MSLRLSSSQSAHYVSLWGGLGIPGSNVPADGDNGGSPLANDGLSPVAEYRIETIAQPSAGTLRIYPDTSYVFSGGPDGAYSWTYRLFEDSIDRGTATEYWVVGAPVAAFDVATTLPGFSGVALASPAAAFATVSGLPALSGGFCVLGALPLIAINAVTLLPSFAVLVCVSPVASCAARTDLPVLSSSFGTQSAAAFAVLAPLPAFAGSVAGGGGYTRAPSGVGPSIILPGTHRPGQTSTRRH